MKILMICKHNRFRSKMAEAIFNKLNKNKNIKAESAGTLLDEAHPYIAKDVLEEAGKRGYKIKGEPRQLTRELLDRFDMLVIVADNLDKRFFHDYAGKIIQWDIPDCDQSDVKSIRKISDEIEEKVKWFVGELSASPFGLGS